MEKCHSKFQNIVIAPTVYYDGAQDCNNREVSCREDALPLSSPAPTSWDTTVKAGGKAAILDYEVAWLMEASHSRAAKCKKRGSPKQGSTASYHIHRTFT